MNAKPPGCCVEPSILAAESKREEHKIFFCRPNPSSAMRCNIQSLAPFGGATRTYRAVITRRPMATANASASGAHRAPPESTSIRL